MNNETTEVFHKIEGLEVNCQDPVCIGNFTFYNYKLHKQYLMKKCLHNIKIEDFKFADNMMKSHDAWVSVKFNDTDDTSLQIQVRTKFELLQNILRFLTSFLKNTVDVGIYNYRKWSYDEVLIFKEGQRPGYKSVYKGAVDKTDLINLLDSFTARLISAWDIIKKSSEDLISALDKRTMAAINFYGRALYNFDDPVCFLESMMAIEALISNYNKSASSQIAEYSAFLLTDSYSNRIAIETKMRNFYKLRSKLAHGTISNVSSHECSNILFYVKKLIIVFLTNKEIQKLSTVINDDKLGKKLDSYIQKLRYN